MVDQERQKNGLEKHPGDVVDCSFKKLIGGLYQTLGVTILCFLGFGSTSNRCSLYPWRASPTRRGTWERCEKIRVSVVAMPPKDIGDVWISPRLPTSTHLQMPEAIHLHASHAFSDARCPLSIDIKSMVKKLGLYDPYVHLGHYNKLENENDL